MKKQVFSQFGGIAPRYAPGLKKGMAQTAMDCDISSGKIRPVAGPLAVGTGTGNSLHYHDGAWLTGADRCFTTWPINSANLLMYLADDGTPMKTVGGETAELGQVRPGTPTVALQSPYVRFRWSPGSLGTGTFYMDTPSGTTERAGRLGFVESANVSGEYFASCLLDEDADGDYAPIGFGNYAFISPGVIITPGAVYLNDNELSSGVYGSLEVDEWAWVSSQSYDTAWSTVYCKPSDLSPVSVQGVSGLEQVAWWDTHGALEMTLVENPGGVTDTVRYAITTLRDIGGHVDESGLGPVSESATALHGVVRVTRPAITDGDVTHWNLYRIGDLSGEYQFVASIPIATETYDDSLDASEVGAAPTTYYTSDQGNKILFSKPDAFDGLAGPHAGMLFGWRGNVLFWSEPGVPDAWPAYYSLNFPAGIRAVVSMAGSVAVLTALGAFRLDGTHPELLQETESIGMEPCPGSCAAKTSRGVCYLSDSGIALFDMYRTTMVTDGAFTEGFFLGMAASGACLVENDGVLYLFHGGGALRLDVTSGTAVWATLSMTAQAAHARPDDGRLYVLSSGTIYDLFGGDGVLSFVWLSGDVYGDSDDHAFGSVSVTGSGDVTLAVYVDGDLKRERALDFTLDRGRTIGLRPEEAGRALWFEVSGAGTVTEVMVK